MSINTNTSLGISFDLKERTDVIVTERNKGQKHKVTDFSKHTCEALEEYNKKFNHLLKKKKTK